ncbi:MAG: cysteine desulfuration protein SufE [Paracoccaceae bacterium]|jgi:cysteine desulfuration protein SufE
MSGFHTGPLLTGIIGKTAQHPNTEKASEMASAAFEDIAEDFEFLDDWEDRYRHVIDLGKAMTPVEDALKVAATKVDGCASQVWLVPETSNGVFNFRGDSDAMIVRGLIAVLVALFDGLSLGEVAKVDAGAEMARLGLDQHLSAQRSNGLRAMLERIYQVAQSAEKENARA